MQTRCGGSGRGGGYKTTTYSAWAFVTWDFAGNVISWTRSIVPNYAAGFSQVDIFGDALYDSGTVAYLAVPAPLAPTDVTVAQAGDRLEVSWAPVGVNPLAIRSSVLTVTPVNSSASILTATVTGSANSGLIAGVQPLTTYQVTVANSSIGGSGPASASVSITTAAASVAPSAPTGLSARWTAEGATTATLLATWIAAAPGDSPIDQYKVTTNGSDGGGYFTQYVPGTSLTASFAGISFIPDWSVVSGGFVFQRSGS